MPERVSTALAAINEGDPKVEEIVGRLDTKLRLGDTQVKPVGGDRWEIWFAGVDDGDHARRLLAELLDGVDAEWQTYLRISGT